LTATDPDDPDGFQADAGLVGTYGTATIDATGNWSYTLDDANPAVDALNVGDSLIDTITVQTVDGTTQDITITISGANSQPSLSDAALIVDENTVGGTAVGTLTALDPDLGDTIGYTITAGNTGGAFAIDSASGVISVGNAAILDHETNPVLVFTVEARDAGGLSDTAQVTVQIRDVNEAPTNVMPSSQTTIGSTPLFFSPATGNAISVLEADAGDPVVELTLTATRGSVSLAVTQGLTFLAGDGTSDNTVTVQGALSDVNAALDGLRFDPEVGFSGSATLAASVSDLGGSGGPPLTDSDTISIDVQPPPPIDTIPDDDEETTDDGDPDDGPDEDIPTEVVGPDTDDPTDEGEADPVIESRPLGSSSERRAAESGSDTRSIAEAAATSILDLLGEDLLMESESVESEDEENEQHKVTAGEFLWPEVRDVAQDLSSDAERQEEANDFALASIESVGLALSVGALSVLARGGSLIAMALSSLPIWQRVDPLSVIIASDRDREAREDEQRAIDEEESQLNKGLDDLLDSPPPADDAHESEPADDGDQFQETRAKDSQ
jgi:VCBS repeat-containing protein